MNFHDIRTEEDEDRYQLHVRDETNGESYTIAFDGSKTVRGVKEDFSSLCEIPVRLQVWSGWPSTVSDSLVNVLKIMSYVACIHPWGGLCNPIYPAIPCFSCRHSINAV